MSFEKSLLEKARIQTEAAMKTGALQSIPTEELCLPDSGIPFVVRKLPTLHEKNRLPKTGDGRTNPFLPYNPELFVAEISGSHICLLNKYNVVPYHLLIVTREFEEQSSFLNLKDFEAFEVCLRDFEGLGFYNAGFTAGASQPHKHLQYVPLPLAPGGPAIPVEALFPAARGVPSFRITSIPGLPFVSAFAWVDSTESRLSAGLEKIYRSMVADAGSGFFPHNLLLTRSWMLLVPRSVECFQGISVNALGFAGSLLVRDDQELDTVRQVGPMRILRGVAVPAFP